jgi:hypothetical protein
MLLALKLSLHHKTEGETQMKTKLLIFTAAVFIIGASQQTFAQFAEFGASINGVTLPSSAGAIPNTLNPFGLTPRSQPNNNRAPQKTTPSNRNVKQVKNCNTGGAQVVFNEAPTGPVKLTLINKAPVVGNQCIVN